MSAAMLAAGVGRTRTTPVSGAPRLPYCMMGVCFDCLVTVDGVDSTWENTADLSLGRSSDSGVGSLTITDNGTGERDQERAGFGLLGLRERLALLGGALVGPEGLVEDVRWNTTEFVGAVMPPMEAPTTAQSCSMPRWRTTSPRSAMPSPSNARPPTCRCISRRADLLTGT